MNASVVENRPIMGDVVVGMCQAPAQSIELQRFDFVAGGNLDGIKFVHFWWTCAHGRLLPIVHRSKCSNLTERPTSR